LIAIENSTLRPRSKREGEIKMKQSKSWLLGTITILILLLGGNGQAFSQEFQIAENQQAYKSIQYEDHFPFLIDGNDEFKAQTEAEEWPGDGNTTTPYVIDGFKFSGPSDSNLIDIRNTDFHFYIVNCLLERGKTGIYFYNVTNGHITDNTIIKNNDAGISMVSSRNCTISYNDIIDNYDNGVQLSSSDDCLITNNSINNKFYWGQPQTDDIEIDFSFNCTIANNTLRSISDHGIHLIHSDNCTISANYIFSGDGGLFLDHSSNCTIINNIFSENDWGMSIEYSDNCTISNNTISNNYHGFSILYSNYSTINNNNISENWGTGLSIWYCDYFTITKNTISNNNNYYGLFMRSSGSCVITNNIISNNDQDGIYMDDSSDNCTITNNTICDNNGNGMYMDSSDNCLIANNSINFNANGIDLDSSANCTVTNNTICYNYDDGIDMYSSPNCTITNNAISNNNDNGINIHWYSVNCTISNNSINNNQHGISMTTLVDCTISNNSVNNNTYRGIGISGWSVNCTISSNSINNNQQGISMSHSGNCTISRNSVNNNRYGIDMSHSGNCTINNNSINNNMHGIELFLSSDNIITNNNFKNCGLDFDFPLVYHSDSLNDYTQQQVTGNIVNDKPLLFWQHVVGETVPSDCGQIILIDTTAVEVTNQLLSNITIGLIVAFGNNVTIYNNIFTHNTYDGIHMYSSVNSAIRSNSISNNNRHGINMEHSSFCVINSNNISTNNETGIRLDSSDYCTITQNNFIDNGGASQAVDDGQNNIFEYNYWDGWSYSISGNRDHHPLTTPFVPHDLTVFSIIFPSGGETFNRTVTAQWGLVNDPHNHSVTYAVYYSTDNGSTWILLVSGSTPTTYVWNTSTVVNGNNYQLKVVAKCSQGVITQAISATFTIINIKPTKTTNLSLEDLVNLVFPLIFFGLFFSFGSLLLIYRFKQRIRFVRRLLNRKTQIKDDND
jgi:parallel beta-helix repeat protein